MYLLASIALLATVIEAQSIDLTQYVLPSTGDTDGGNTFPGVSEPFGMVKLGPDLYTGSDSYSGYASSGNFTGFSMMHESGTGGAPKYGVVSQMPVLGNITNPLNDHNDTRSSPDLMEVGYYKAELGSNITVELSATSRAGLYQYTFPEGGGTPNIIVDVSHVLPSYRGQGLSQQYTSGNITILSDGHYEGFGVYNNGWNLSPDWTIYFCGYFDSPATYKTFTGLNGASSILAQYDNANSVFSTARLGAVFSFASATTVVSRIGVSFISSAQACSNVQLQIPDGTALSSVTSQTKNAWNTEILSKITTTETNTTQLELLYSSLYHMHLMPSNRTGENPLWRSTEPYYDDTFTLWDLFRCGTSLMHIINPIAYEEYIRSLIDIFRFEGYMPDARSSNFNGAIQGGTNSDNVLADAYVKGVRGAINWQDGFAAMVKNAEIAPLNNNDTRDLSSSTKEGRGALSDYATLGYITPKYGRSVTRAVEYSVNDFSLYQVAVGLNQTESATKYVLRSRNWRNHWNPNATSLNFTGFVVPRSEAGFIAQDPLSCAGCYWGDAYYEALPWEYSFNAHHDINTLIALSGGPTTFTSRLEAMFTPGINTSGRSAGFNNTIFNPGNEPSFTTPYLYNYVGRQDLSVKRSRFVAKTYYSATPGGLPGNSDSGAMESWVIWNILGLYPMVGQTTFLIGSPWFANTTISLGSGKSLSMTTVNGSETSFYVQSLQVNGVSWNQSWLTWDDVFENGGTMDFVMGPNPAKWDIGPAPPSPASEFSDTTSPNTIVPPSTVSNAPSPAQILESAKRRRMLRDVAFGMMAVGIVGISTASFLWWFLRRKKQKMTTALTAANTIEDKEVKKEENDQSRGTTAHSDHKQESLDRVKSRWHNFSIGDRQKSHKSSASDASTLVEWALGRVHNRSPSDEEKGGGRSIKSDTSTPAPEEDGKDEKKAPLTIAVLGVPSEAQEPWTPNGINRRMEEGGKED